MGNVTTIRNGDIQVMSAGTGIKHSEYNKNGDKPVSYTHLRAHETVLDLVCRLLLEKKKKKNNNEHEMHINSKSREWTD